MSENTLFIAENPNGKPADASLVVGLGDLVLTPDMPTSAGSKMLAGFKSLFPARVAERLQAAGHHIAGKVNIGEFGFDFLGETSWFGPVTNGSGSLTTAAAQLLAATSVDAVVGLDVNGTEARAAALAGQVHVKPTYGCVSRFGTVAIACSGETVDITARSAETAQRILDALAGHDDADGTSLPESECARVTSDGFDQAATAGEVFAAPVAHVKVARGLADTADDDTKRLLDAALDALRAEGVAVSDTAPATDELLKVASTAWNILMCAELCNNVNRFEGMKYGYQAEKCQSIDELYTRSRTEAFGALTKTAILYGSEVLAADNYDRCYDKALRIRRLVSDAIANELAGSATSGEAAGQTAIILPACAKRSYSCDDVEANPYLVFDENRFTAPAAISGLPAVVAGGVQVIGAPFSDVALLRLGDVLASAVSAGKEA